MTDKERFINIVKDLCQSRVDVEKFIQYLKQNTDFFEAPASTKFHLCERGGLLKHSLDVYDNLVALTQIYYEDVNYESVAIVGLFHDLCKANFYKLENKWVKANEKWTTKQVYVVNDEFPIGHGEKSVIMLLRQNFKLTDEEICAIRWHMNGFDCAVKGGEIAFQNAMNSKHSKLATLLQAADIIAANIVEGDC